MSYFASLCHVIDIFFNVESQYISHTIAESDNL